MKVLLPFLLAALLAVAYGATIEPVRTSEPAEVAKEVDEYRWRQKVGQALERVGKWLQGKYTAVTEEEEEKFVLMTAQLEEVAADVSEHLGQLDSEVDEDGDEVASYGLRKRLRKWRKKLAKLGKKIGTAVVINKAVGAVAAATG